MTKESPYKVLGVNKTASSAQIKTAFRKLAMTWHPDQNPHNSDAAEARFKVINEAYEILNDPDKRAAYDRYGWAAFEKDTSRREHERKKTKSTRRSVDESVIKKLLERFNKTGSPADEQALAASFSGGDSGHGDIATIILDNINLSYLSRYKDLNTKLLSLQPREYVEKMLQLHVDGFNRGQKNHADMLGLCITSVSFVGPRHKKLLTKNFLKKLDPSRLAAANELRTMIFARRPTEYIDVMMPHHIKTFNATGAQLDEFALVKFIGHNPALAASIREKISATQLEHAAALRRALQTPPPARPGKPSASGKSARKDSRP